MRDALVAEYLWIDGSEPTPKLRSKTKIIHDFGEATNSIDPSQVPTWGFDGSSTNQASGENSDCILKPVNVKLDPMVMCEVLDADGTPNKTNYRNKLSILEKDVANQEYLFGLEQEYVLVKNGRPLGWPDNDQYYPRPQGPFYCGVGADEVFGLKIKEEHLEWCLYAGIQLSGTIRCSGPNLDGSISSISGCARRRCNS